ncbi:MAG: acetylornithine deacetylase [Paracoccus sp. (in: a-proteobacteria)]|nr:acetylornithine deacetylase [Paracoccus sp. (in: a-proteobacteria)]
MAVPDTVSILRDLVAFAILPRQPNTAMLDYIAGLFAGGPARISRFPGPDAGQANMLIQIGPSGAGGVMLSAHSDVVAVEGQHWTSDPFTLTGRGDRLYGRGTADMKGFLASAIRALLLAQDRDLAQPLQLAVSYDEEIGCVGVRGLVAAMQANSDRPALCIVGEPTAMRIAVGHKGKSSYRAICTGREAHSALAPDALNALHLGAEFIGALRGMQDELAQGGNIDPDYEIGYSTIHAGLMQGGTALNIVPETCRIDFEIRNISTDLPERIILALNARAAEIADRYRARFPEAAIRIELLNAYPGLETDARSAAVGVVRQLTGDNAPAIKVAFGTEAGFFSGLLGIATVVCGPGDMAQGHRADEYVTRDQLGRCDRMLENLIDRLCAP